MQDLQEEEQRRRAIAWALRVAENTPLAPLAGEQELLERYAHGELTLAQVLVHLDDRVHQVLYRSRATAPLSTDQLANLLVESQPYNEEHGISGLLCYGDGFIIQLLEGAAYDVQTLYAKIQRDPRHRQLVTLRDAPSPRCLFADGQMALVRSDSQEMYWLITHLGARRQHLLVPQVPITQPYLLTLLAAFSA